MRNAGFKDMIPTQEIIDKFISPIENVIFIGYPSGIWDSKNLFPIVRKGLTATPYYIDFLGEQKFLIDASVFPGSSGSPVFAYSSGSYSDKHGGLYFGDFVQFLGIIAETFHRQDEGDIIIKNIPTKDVPFSISKQMIDLGIVYKAITIEQTIQHYFSVLKERLCALEKNSYEA